MGLLGSLPSLKGKEVFSRLPRPRLGASKSAEPSALVVVGPSGVGKGTLVGRLKADGSRYGYSCSHTTRDPRPGEKNGTHYHFVSRASFQAGIRAGKFLEHATVHRQLYGTTRSAVQKVTRSGRCCILELDVQGARQVRKSGLQAIFVFIAPPSLEELERRLRERGTENEAQIAVRMDAARTELSARDEPGLFDLVIVNDDVDRAYEELEAAAQRAIAGETGVGPEGRGSGAGLGGATGAGASAPYGATGGATGLPAGEPSGVSLGGADGTRSLDPPPSVFADVLDGDEEGEDAFGLLKGGEGGVVEQDGDGRLRGGLGSGAIRGSGSAGRLAPGQRGAGASAASPSPPPAAIRTPVATPAASIGRGTAGAATTNGVGVRDPESDGTDGSGSASASGKSAEGLRLARSARRRRIIQLLGCDSALGGVLAVQLAMRGQRVVALGRDRDGLVRLQRAAVAAGVPADDFLPVLCDLGKEAEVAALARIVDRRWPGRAAECVLAVADEPSPAPGAGGLLGSGPSGGGWGGATPAGSGAITPGGASLYGGDLGGGGGLRSGMVTPAGSAYGGGGGYAGNGAGAGGLGGGRSTRLLDGDATGWFRAMHAPVLGQALAVREAVASMTAHGTHGSVLWVLHRDEARDQGAARAAKAALAEVATAQRREAEARRLPVSVALLTLSRRSRGGTVGGGSHRRTYSYEDAPSGAATPAASVREGPTKESVAEAARAVISALDYVLHHPEVGSVQVDLPASA